MARAFWKGAISFGMVIIPVKMYPGIASEAPGLHLLHGKCLTRPKQVLYCEADNEYFTSKETVRGYEWAKGHYVVLDERDFEKVPVKTLHTIYIQGFASSQEIDPIYFHDSHYLEPEELAAKPFALLRETLLKAKRVGVAKVTFQRREHLCCVRPLDDIMVLQTMYYQDEILPRTEFAPPKQELGKEELDMAESLVNIMASDFKLEDYKDEYREALNSLIQAKIKGLEIVAPKPKKVEITDLMSALRASIEAAHKEVTPRPEVEVAEKK